MSTTATRRTPSRPKLLGAPPRELFTGGVLPVQVVPNGRVRGRSLVRSLSVQITYAAIDAALVCIVGILLVSFGLGDSAQRHAFNQVAGQAYAGFFLLYAALVVLGCANQNLYRTPRDRSVLDESLMVARAVGVATALLILFIFITAYNDISRLVVLSAGVFNVLTLSGWRYFKRRRVLHRSAAGIGVSRVLIVGAGRTGQALASWFEENPHLGYHVCGFLDSNSKGSSGSRVLGTIKDLRKIALTQFADELFVTLPAEREMVKTTVLEARELRLGLKLLPDLYDGLGWRAPLHMIGGFPVMDLQWQPIPAVGLAMKRAMDILLAGFALVVTSPFLLLLTILIRFDSPGPVLYIADRVGHKGSRFRCFKLRTMCVGADQRKEELRAENQREGPIFKLEDDPRITRLGRWLRRTSFDELPQLWNVIRGDMSLVGPRPHPVDDFERYSLENLRRLDVSPGLTGLWQVTARNDPSWETNMALDLEYIENWSISLDLKILFKTIPAVLRAEGR